MSGNVVSPMKKGNICFDCDNACGDCSWSAVDPDTGKLRFEPVPGWTATPVKLNMGKGRIHDTYHITACPQFRNSGVRKQPKVAMTLEMVEEMISRLLEEGAKDNGTAAAEAETV